MKPQFTCQMAKFNDDTEIQIDQFELFDVYSKNLSTQLFLNTIVCKYIESHLSKQKPYSGPES